MPYYYEVDVDFTIHSSNSILYSKRNLWSNYNHCTFYKNIKYNKYEGMDKLAPKNLLIV